MEKGLDRPITIVGLMGGTPLDDTYAVLVGLEKDMVKRFPINDFQVISV